MALIDDLLEHIAYNGHKPVIEFTSLSGLEAYVGTTVYHPLVGRWLIENIEHRLKMSGSHTLVVARHITNLDVMKLSIDRLSTAEDFARHLYGEMERESEADAGAKAGKVEPEQAHEEDA